jgi:hypothetical protein
MATSIEHRTENSMKSLTIEHFEQWLSSYGRASEENDPRASADLFAEDATYYESPFDEPLVGREAIYGYWLAGAQRLADKRFSHAILAVRGNVGVARWQANCIVKDTGIILILDAIFVVEFDAQGRCIHFREWWHACNALPSRRSSAFGGAALGPLAI